MKQSMASVWIYMIVITFILMFVAFLTLSLTYSKNYKTKNEIINIIEKYEGINKDSVRLINNYLTTIGYSTKHTCPTTERWMGATSIESTYTTLEKTRNGVKYYYCVNEKNYGKTVKNQKNGKAINVKSKKFYQVRIFFRFNLPVMGNVYTFSVDGTTNDIYLNVRKLTNSSSSNNTNTNRNVNSPSITNNNSSSSTNTTTNRNLSDSVYRNVQSSDTNTNNSNTRNNTSTYQDIINRFKNQNTIRN